MISMVDEVLGGKVLNFSGARAIGVSSENLKPGDDGIVPLSKQNKFEFVEKDGSKLDLVDLNMGNLVGDNNGLVNPVEVSDPSVLGNMNPNLGVTETPEINPYVSQEVFTPTDMSIPQMPQPEAVAPTEINESLFANTTSEPVVETPTETVQSEEHVQDQISEPVVEDSIETPMQSEIPSVSVSSESTPVTSEPINDSKSKEFEILNSEKLDLIVKSIDKSNNKLESIIKEIMETKDSIRKLLEEIKTKDLGSQEALSSNTMNNIPTMEVPASTTSDIPTLNSIDPGISSIPSINVEPPVIEPSIPSLENPMSSSTAPSIDNMGSQTPDIPLSENSMAATTNPIDETKIQGMFIN